MDKVARRAALLEWLQRAGRVEVAEASARFETAEMTIRRDLDVLAAQGAARRVRGGAISLLLRAEEPPFSVRSVAAGDAKRRIGRVAAELLVDGESVALDSGTTTLEVARCLTGRRLTVMPMSLHAASELAGMEGVRLLMPGGEVRPGELSLVGPLATASLAALRFDTALLSCCGLADGQVTAHDLGDAEVKRAMRAAASRTVLVVDSSKFARSATAVVCPVSDVDVVVTDGSIAPDVAAELRGSGVELLPV
ncbi:MAG TPA: DeoR/GlpR family DNA-binding transcription regulator [Acidimicrobiales bacterium]|nr:DeoR/GlpR family DNA-binding transcription regulator [Acidimicrobiales bacterium]